MKRFIQYVKNAYSELVEKVTWSSWSVLQSSAIVVMIASALFAVVVLAMDLAFENIFNTIYSLLY